MGWAPYDTGRTLGQTGSETGRTIQDEEHDLGARITLEEDCQTAPYAITCGIYGWMVHTRFFSNRRAAEEAMGDMKRALEAILESIPNSKDPDADRKSARVSQAISDFVARFP